MAKKSITRKPGRPVATNPKKLLVSFRLDAAREAKLAKYRDSLNVDGLSLSHAARNLVILVLDGKL